MKRFSSWSLQLTTSILLLAALAIPAAQAADDKKADPTGTWTWTMQRRQGGDPREVTMKIKSEEGKLAGTIATGAQGRETKLQNIKMTGDELSFDTTREFNGNTITQKYKGKVTADTITGKISTERNGQSNERDWTAKRKKEEKKSEAK